MWDVEKFISSISILSLHMSVKPPPIHSLSTLIQPYIPIWILIASSFLTGSLVSSRNSNSGTSLPLYYWFDVILFFPCISSLCWLFSFLYCFYSFYSRCDKKNVSMNSFYYHIRSLSSLFFYNLKREFETSDLKIEFEACKKWMFL